MRSRGALHRLGLLGSLVVSGCDSAFTSRGLLTPGPLAELEFTFEDGSNELDLSEGKTFKVLLFVPTAGYRKAVDSKNASVDVDRLIVTANLPIGDPGQGGIAPGNNLTQFFVDHGWLSVGSEVDRRVPLTIEFDTLNPEKFEVGFWVFQMSIVDDQDRPSEPLSVSMSLIALDRPTGLARAEIPSLDSSITGVILPTDSSGRFLLGEQLPFALVVEAFANPESTAGFLRVVTEVGVDPERLMVSADAGLGEFAAGDNLAPLFGTDLEVELAPDGRHLVVGARFELGSDRSPPLGITTFSVVILDDLDVASGVQAFEVVVEPAVTLSAGVQPVFTSLCASAGCHGSLFPALDLVLAEGQTHANTVLVRAFETPEDSCARDRVEPYQPAASYLLHKILGTYADDCVKGQPGKMPPGGQVEEPDIEKVRKWIEQGAFNH